MLSKRNSAMQRVIYQTPIPPGNLWWSLGADQYFFATPSSEEPRLMFV